MNGGPNEKLSVLARIVQQFGLTSLDSVVQACEALAAGGPIDIAVLGAFNSGKSSLLNALLGENAFPVGAVPVTAVITRAVAGNKRTIEVSYEGGATEEVAPDRLVEFVTESGNPGNRRQVALVDLSTPAMRDWPGLRLVDTPGLGSVLAHNTEATQVWMPSAAVALVTISAQQPFSDADRRLVAEARQTAPRIIVVLTKVDLLRDDERSEVALFLDGKLHESFGAAILVLPFSCRFEPKRWIGQLREKVLEPVAANAAEERRSALALKLETLATACRGYLAVAADAAERTDAERERLRSAVFTESVSTALIRDELRLAQERVSAGTRTAFKERLFSSRPALEMRIKDALAADLQTWEGNLAQQARRYEAWMTDRLKTELRLLSEAAQPVAVDLLGQAEARFRRVVEAFRDRLSRNIRETTGITVSLANWEAKPPQMSVIPVAVSGAFMTHWDLLWWMLPMWLVGSLFRRHVIGRVPWEVEKNLIRLIGDWAGAVDAAITDLRIQAIAWVNEELTTLIHLLGQQPNESTALLEAIRKIEETGLQHRM